MQESSSPSSWPYAVYVLIAGFLGYVAKHGVDYIKLFMERRKPHAEIHRTHAESTEIFIRAGVAASDSISRMIEKLEIAQERSQATIDRLRMERDAWEREYGQEFKLRKELETRVDLLVIEADSLKDQMEGAYAFIKFLGRHPTDVDKFRVELKSKAVEEPKRLE